MIQDRRRPPDPTVGRAQNYEKAKSLARHDKAEVRAELASSADVNPELLYFLAGDADPTVRRCVATNVATPGQADLLLARDKDVDVRADLAEKIAPRASGLLANETDPVRRLTFETLEILVRDKIPRIRRIIAETLKDFADAPIEVVASLARDSDPSVASPLLEHSPMLSDDDILAIIRPGLASESLGAIGRRRGIGEAVCDAVAATKNVDAITHLLANTSAQVREEALDQLIAQAPMIVAWHDPLVRRPTLPPGATLKLIRFIADALLIVLLDRSDLDKNARKAITKEVHRRIEENGSDLAEASPEESDTDMARRMFAAGDLTDAAIEAKVRAGKSEFTTEALALRSTLNSRIVQKIIANSSAKGVVALCRKAEVPMIVAVEVQRRLARIVPSAVLVARRNGDYPLSEEEMDWHLQFFADLAR